MQVGAINERGYPVWPRGKDGEISLHVGMYFRCSLAVLSQVEKINREKRTVLLRPIFDLRTLAFLETPEETKICEVAFESLISFLYQPALLSWTRPHEATSYDAILDDDPFDSA